MCFKLQLYYRKGTKPVRYIEEQTEHKYLCTLGGVMEKARQTGQKSFAVEIV